MAQPRDFTQLFYWLSGTKKGVKFVYKKKIASHLWNFVNWGTLSVND